MSSKLERTTCERHLVCNSWISPLYQSGCNGVSQYHAVVEKEGVGLVWEENESPSVERRQGIPLSWRHCQENPLRAGFQL